MIDLDSFTMEELQALNRRVVDKIKEREAGKVSNFMGNFTIGDKVYFEPPGEEIYFGLVVKKNQKTISVQTLTGGKWKVHPAALKHHNNENVTDGEWTLINAMTSTKKK